MQTYKEEYLVDFRDVDRTYHLKFPQLLEILGTVSTKHTAYVGFDPMYLNRKGLAWILYEWNVQMLETNLYANKISIETFVVQKRGMYFVRYFAIYDSEQKMIGRAFSKWVVADLEKRRIVKIPDEILQCFGAREGIDEIEQKFIEKMPSETLRQSENRQFSFEQSFSVRFYDVDANCHVNNVRYVEWAVESLHRVKNFLETYRPKSLCILYKKEKSPEGKVIVKTRKENNSTYHEVYSDEGVLLTLLQMDWVEK